MKSNTSNNSNNVNNKIFSNDKSDRSYDWSCVLLIQAFSTTSFLLPRVSKLAEFNSCKVSRV